MSAPGLDLDAIENEDDPGPFPVTLGGQTYSTDGPADMDYRELLQLVVDAKNGKVVSAIEKIISKDDREGFWSHQLPVFKLTALMQGYMAHYKLATVPEAVASSPSS